MKYGLTAGQRLSHFMSCENRISTGNRAYPRLLFVDVMIVLLTEHSEIIGIIAATSPLGLDMINVEIPSGSTHFL